jgi:hypothetical protein
MADHQLGTRDLATRSEAGGSASSLEPEQQPADRSAATNPARDEDRLLESAQSEEPVTRESTADSPQTGTRATETGIDGRDGNGDVAHASERGGHPDTMGTATASGDREPLLPADQSERLTTRWQEIQTSFVDKPRDAVAEADALVADLMQRLAAGFAHERERLESQWDSGDDVSTEDLRVALTRYRSFFDRLLSA